MMLILLKIITAVLLVQLGFALWNVAMLPRLGTGRRGRGISPFDRYMHSEPHDRNITDPPLLSICIPARNESLHIGDCLRAVLASQIDGFAMEVLVLDDRSTDGTADIVRDLSIQDSRIRLLSGNELPFGWIGKSFACHQLAKAARGTWLLFLDADVRLGREALAAGMNSAIAQERGLITGFPHQQTGTWLEKLIVPMMFFTISCHLPIIMVQRSRDPRFVAAHGAFMLIHRESYDACGGHEAIKSGLVDDMALARNVKKSGQPVMLAEMHHYISMRMYRNAREVWNGYRKNIYEGVGRSGLLLWGVLLLYTFLYLLPPITAGIIWLIGFNDMIIWAGAATLIGMAVKGISDRAGGQAPWLCLLLPASIACLAVIAISSWRTGITGGGYIWKGRRYE